MGSGFDYIRATASSFFRTRSAFHERSMTPCPTVPELRHACPPGPFLIYSGPPQDSVSMTLQAGIFGYPIAHSISPAMHQAALDHAGIDATYDAWETPPNALARGVSMLRGDDYHGRECHSAAQAGGDASIWTRSTSLRSGSGRSTPSSTTAADCWDRTPTPPDSSTRSGTRPTSPLPGWTRCSSAPEARRAPRHTPWLWRGLRR